MLQFTLYADFICPFCYAAEVGLLPTLRERHELNVTWQPFELHPETPPEGRTIGEKNVERFWSGARRLSEQWGLPISKQPPARLPNTRLALQAAEAARAAGCLAEFRRAAYQAYFLERRDLGDPKVLDELLPDSNWQAPAWGLTIQAKRNDALALCITAVPAFVMDQRVLFGLQHVDVLSRFIEARQATLD